MKNLLVSISFLLLFSKNLSAQDATADRWYDNGNNTQIDIPMTGSVFLNKTFESSWEDIFKLKISDASSDFFKIRNATGVDNDFIPWIIGNSRASNRISLFISGFVPTAYDNSTEPIVVFDARRYDDPDLMTNGGRISTRSLFNWRSYTTTFMQMNAAGYLGIGTTNPSAQLHTTGGVRFAGLSSSASQTFIVCDASGNLGSYTLPLNTAIAPLNVGSTLNFVPKIGASNSLINSQISDNGTNIGIGGNPAANAKVTDRKSTRLNSSHRH